MMPLLMTKVTYRDAITIDSKGPGRSLGTV